ncbi:MAG: V-type ATPase subunit [candidate division WOR-3 bacterium]
MKSSDLKWSDKADYGYAIGLVRALEAVLLGRSQYDRLVRTKDVAEFISIAADFGYSSRSQEAAGSATEFPQVLSRAQEENFAFFAQYCLDRWVLDLFRIQADVHNLKVLLKHRLTGTEPKPDELLGHGRLSLAKLGGLVAEPERARGQGPESESELSAYRIALAEARQEFERTGDPALIDIRLDRLAQELALSAARPSRFLTGYFSLHADLVNLVTLVRIKELGEEPGLFRTALLPGGRLSPELLNDLLFQDWDALVRSFKLGEFQSMLEDGLAGLRGPERSFLRLERRAREMELDWLRQSRWTAFGYEPLVTFYLWRANEHTNLRRLYAAKLLGWSERECRELIAYVE